MFIHRGDLDNKNSWGLGKVELKPCRKGGRIESGFSNVQNIGSCTGMVVVNTLLSRINKR